MVTKHFLEPNVEDDHTGTPATKKGKKKEEERRKKKEEGRKKDASTPEDAESIMLLMTEGEMLMLLKIDHAEQGVLLQEASRLQTYPTLYSADPCHRNIVPGSVFEKSPVVVTCIGFQSR